MKIEDHPTVKHVREKDKAGEPATVAAPGKLDATELRQLALSCGADDVGLVEIGRRELDPQRDEIFTRFPWTKTLLSFVCRMNREPIRSPARSVANLEFHHRGEEVDEISRSVVAQLQEKGVRAINPSMGFPMEMNQFPNRIWVVAHKPVAVAAGLGHMGIHRNIIHPKFGNFILLGTVLLDAEATAYDHPIDYNPCLECNLCVAACPVGAISSDGHFDFSACFTHNYRDFMGGFNDWVEQVAGSKDALDYRRQISEPETGSVWQSLSFGPSYKSAYCLSVCPAGEEVIRPFLTDRSQFLKEVVKPLQQKRETVYVVAGSDAEAHVAKRFKQKRATQVGNALRPQSIQALLDAMPHIFQRNRAAGLEATYHFTFTGAENREATVVIHQKTVAVSEGHTGAADLHVMADTRTWLEFLARERNLLWALLTRKIRLKGSVRLLQAFGKCFPTPSIRHRAAKVYPMPPLARPEVLPFRRN